MNANWEMAAVATSVSMMMEGITAHAQIRWFFLMTTAPAEVCINNKTTKRKRKHSLYCRNALVQD